MPDGFDTLLEPPPPPEGDVLVVDVDGYEGPLDLLLELARRQKVDLARISILALAEQYLAFVEEARRLRLELAADYLVMAAWLAYLKSRLLLPEAPKGEEPPAEELAAALAFRLRRLEAMRLAVQRLTARPQLGLDVFTRGMPEGIYSTDSGPFQASLHDVLSAYADMRRRTAEGSVRIPMRTVWTLAEAREILETLVGHAAEWMALDEFLIRYLVEPETRATVRASCFTAALILAKEGRLDLRQEENFGPLLIRNRDPRREGAANV